MKRFINYSIPYKPSSPAEFLRFGSGLERFYFESDQSPVAIAGLGIAAQITGEGTNRFAELGRSMQAFFDQILCSGGTGTSPRPILLGGGSFFGSKERGIWDSFPQAALILPRYALIRINGETYFSVNLPLKENESGADASQRARLASRDFLDKFEGGIPGAAVMPDEISTHETPRADWTNAIGRSVEMIRRGGLKKIVLARPLHVTGNRTIDVPAMLENLGQSCPSCFRFLFEFSPGTTFAGATPERLVSVSGAKFKTAAIAGSIRRGRHPAEDEMLGQQLIASAKDQSEHDFVVAQIREKMSPLAEALTLDPAPELLRLPNIQHLRTNISGGLKADHNILSIAAALHPTPAVGGTPTGSALRVMRTLEGFGRGWYAAPVGWVDADGNGDFVVAIRSGLFHENSATLFGGAGIVANSDPDKEWEETGLKISFLLNAMQAECA